MRRLIENCRIIRRCDHNICGRKTICFVGDMTLRWLSDDQRMWMMLAMQYRERMLNRRISWNPTRCSGHAEVPDVASPQACNIPKICLWKSYKKLVISIRHFAADSFDAQSLTRTSRKAVHITVPIAYGYAIHSSSDILTTILPWTFAASRSSKTWGICSNFLICMTGLTTPVRVNPTAS